MRIVWIIAAAYAFVHVVFAALRWHDMTIGADTGIFAQAILNAAHGFSDGPEGGSHFHYHFAPLLAVLYPVVALSRTPLSLQFVQIALVALTAPAMYALFRPYASHALCVRLAAITLLYPPLAAVGFTEFHETAFFPILAVLLMWAADRARWAWFAVIGAALILTREDVGMELAALGIGLAVVLWLRRQRGGGAGLLFGEPRQANATALAFGALGVVAAAVVTTYFRAVFATYHSWLPSREYVYSFANGPAQLFFAVVTKPWIAIPDIANLDKLGYLLQALVPLLFLPLRNAWSLLAVPALVIILASSDGGIYYVGHHYTAMWAPWLLLGAGVALAHMERRGAAHRAIWWANGAIAACIVTLVTFNPMHLGYYLRPQYADLASAHAALACVPRGASLSTHSMWFAQRGIENSNSTINAADGVDYLVYALDSPDLHPWTAKRLAANVRAGRYVQVCRFGNVVTYKRRALR